MARGLEEELRGKGITYQIKEHICCFFFSINNGVTSMSVTMAAKLEDLKEDIPPSTRAEHHSVLHAPSPPAVRNNECVQTTTSRALCRHEFLWLSDSVEESTASIPEGC